MSTENAHWFFDEVRPGDIVQVVNSERRRRWQPFGNGFGDWNLSWDKWLTGSALGAQATSASKADNADRHQGEASRLAPKA